MLSGVVLVIIIFIKFLVEFGICRQTIYIGNSWLILSLVLVLIAFIKHTHTYTHTMGAYLTAPLTDKESTDETNDYLSCGASQMQGWRMSQEVSVSIKIQTIHMNIK